MARLSIGVLATFLILSSVADQVDYKARFVPEEILYCIDDDSSTYFNNEEWVKGVFVYRCFANLGKFIGVKSIGCLINGVFYWPGDDIPYIHSDFYIYSCVRMRNGHLAIEKHLNPEFLIRERK